MKALRTLGSAIRLQLLHELHVLAVNLTVICLDTNSALSIGYTNSFPSQSLRDTVTASLPYLDRPLLNM